MNHQYQIEGTEWKSWVCSVEQTLGHSLAGNLTTDGYSLDRAYDFFKVGAHWTEYVHEVRTRVQYKRGIKS